MHIYFDLKKPTYSPDLKFQGSFTYKQKQSENQYSNTASKYFNMERFLSDKPAFKHGCLIEKEIKKTIVIADWSLVFWGPNKKNKAISLIQELLKDIRYIFIGRGN